MFGGEDAEVVETYLAKLDCYLTPFQIDQLRLYRDQPVGLPQIFDGMVTDVKNFTRFEHMLFQRIRENF